MKKMIGFLAITMLSNHAFSQDNLQLVTDRDNQTTNGLRVTAAAKLTGGPAVELYYGDNAGNLAAYDRNASAFKPLFIQAQTTSFPNGNVGIGTTSPAYKLDVNGDARFSGNVWSFVSTPEGGALFLKNSLKTGSNADTWAIYNMTGGYGNALQFWRYRADNKDGAPLLKIWDNGNSEFAGGIISAGQTFAHAGFVSGATNAEGFRMSHSGAFISGWNSDNSVRTGYLQFIAGSDVRLDAENGARLSFRTNGSERIRIEENGSVGIGTDNPGSYKLAVEGTVGARKIKVTGEIPWADYVFDSSYNLAPLSHVEKFIQVNKHLPEVPSAAEVKREGLDLGDNQVVLLKKIEELTLYIIRQNKEMQEVKKELEVIKTSLKNVAR